MAETEAGVADYVDMLSGSGFFIPETPASFLPSEVCLFFAACFNLFLDFRLLSKDLPVLPAQAET